MKYLIINARKKSRNNFMEEIYDKDDFENIKVGEMINMLKEYDENSEIVLSFDDCSYGSIKKPKI